MAVTRSVGTARVVLSLSVPTEDRGNAHKGPRPEARGMVYREGKSVANGAKMRGVTHIPVCTPGDVDVPPSAVAAALNAGSVVLANREI